MDSEKLLLSVWLQHHWLCNSPLAAAGRDSIDSIMFEIITRLVRSPRFFHFSASKLSIPAFTCINTGWILHDCNLLDLSICFERCLVPGARSEWTPFTVTVTFHTSLAHIWIKRAGQRTSSCWRRWCRQIFCVTLLKLTQLSRSVRLWGGSRKRILKSKTEAARGCVATRCSLSEQRDRSSFLLPSSEVGSLIVWTLLSIEKRLVGI